MRTRQILFRIGVLVGDEGFSILYFFVMLFVLIIFIFFVHVYDTNAHLIQLQILRRSFLYLENLYNFLMKREKKKSFYPIWMASISKKFYRNKTMSSSVCIGFGASKARLCPEYFRCQNDLGPNAS